MFSTIAHDSTIGDYTSINDKVEITGNSKVGSGCLFGVGASLVPGRRIADWVTVGAGSVVISHINSSKTVFGNPAKSIR
jgi:acetyltransferase EpsM